MSTAPTTRPVRRVADEAALRKALASTPRPPRPSALSAALTFGWRGMLKVKHVPEQLIDVTITPVMFVLMFTYLFGGAIAGSTGEYLDYILPGILVMSVLFTTVSPACAQHRPDQGRGRPLPLAAHLAAGAAVGSVLGDSVRYLVAGTVIIVLGVILGYRPDAGVPGVIAALALVIVFAFGLSWVFTTVGLLMRSPNAVMNAGFMAIFPLTFLSNVFVEPETLPSALEAFVNVNPISILADASRGLMEGTRRRGHRDLAGDGGGADRRLRAADDAPLPQPRRARGSRLRRARRRGRRPSRRSARPVREPFGVLARRHAGQHQDRLHAGLEAGDDVGVHAVADHRGRLGVRVERVERGAHHERVRLADEVGLDARRAADQRGHRAGRRQRPSGDGPVGVGVGGDEPRARGDQPDRRA